jgi:hypothetical protein
MNNWEKIAVFLPFFNLCMSAIAQVAVDKEPHHRVVLENDYLRFLDGKVKFGDTTLSHIHAAESVVVFLSQSTFGIGIKGEKPVITDVKPGDMRYVAYGTKPVTHTVWNQNKGIFHFVVVELKQKNRVKDTIRTLSIPGIKLSLLQESVAAYQLEISRGRQIDIPKSHCAYLLIDIRGGISVNAPAVSSLAAAGELAYFPPQSTIKIKYGSGSHARAVLIALQ